MFLLMRHKLAIFKLNSQLEMTDLYRTINLIIKLLN
jgi:hypothetical protein